MQMKLGEIEIDQNNNIYVGTCTQSTDFPTSNNPSNQLWEVILMDVYLS